MPRELLRAWPVPRAERLAGLVLPIVFALGCSSSSESSPKTSGQEGPDGSATGGASNAGGASGSTGGSSSHGGGSSTGGAPHGGATGSGGASQGGVTGAGGAGASAGQNGQGGACVTLGLPCDEVKPNCCGSLVCVGSTSADYAGCREPCTVATQTCASGCCIPFANYPDRGFCGSASQCQCGGLNAPCGDTHYCCADFTCTTYDSTNTLGCRPKCKVDADCDTNCCVAIPTTPDSACFTPDYCGK